MEEPMMYEEAYGKASEALYNAGLQVRIFQVRTRDIAILDGEIMAHARLTAKQRSGSANAIAAAEKESSPKRKRLIADCQFAMQQANMYSAYASALAAVYMTGG